jgi:thymidylate synthase
MIRPPSKIKNNHLAGHWYYEYLAIITRCLLDGHLVAPRGMTIKENLAETLTIHDAGRTLLVSSTRDLNYRFMLAEFLWIAGGFNDLETLTRYNGKYKAFSDDGLVLTGAYGPRLLPQWRFVLETLRRDPDSRQAIATIWTPSPSPSKDIPCTVAAQFFIRDGELHSIWTMRSSDLWLGLPYDVWTFSMLQAMVAAELRVSVGSLTMQLGSAHLYEEHWGQAVKLVTDLDPAYQLAAGSHFPSGSVDNPHPSSFYSPLTCRAILDGDEHQLRGAMTDVLFLRHAMEQESKAACLRVLLHG